MKVDHQMSLTCAISKSWSKTLSDSAIHHVATTWTEKAWELYSYKVLGCQNCLCPFLSDLAIINGILQVQHSKRSYRHGWISRNRDEFAPESIINVDQIRHSFKCLLRNKYAHDRKNHRSIRREHSNERSKPSCCSGFWLIWLSRRSIHA